MIVVTSRSLQDGSTGAKALGVVTDRINVSDDKLKKMLNDSLPVWARDHFTIDLRKMTENQWIATCHDAGTCMHVFVLETTMVLHYI